MMLARTLKGLGIGLLVIGALLYGVSGGVEENPATAFGGALAMVAGLLLIFRGRQHTAKSDAPRILEDSRPDVVYLRAFRADPSTARQRLMQGLTTEEEQLADVLRPFGDLIAIGRPGESLPLPGAARIYASDAEWQDAVRARIAAAPLVVLRAGVGAGLLWEVEHTIRTVDPGRVVIWVLNLRGPEYEAFRDQVGTRLGLALPDIRPLGLLAAFLNGQYDPSKVAPGFIRFSPAWQPLFLPIRPVWMRLGFNDLRQAFGEALRPVFEVRGVPFRPLGRFER